MWPLIEIAIEPKFKADWERLGVALQELEAEDPTFQVATDPESGQTILRGRSETHLDIKVDTLRNTYNVESVCGSPQVAYRETLGRAADIDHTHKTETGGFGQFARVRIAFEPVEAGAGYLFESKVAGGEIPPEFVPGVEKGLLSVKDRGLLVGFPVIDFKATLTGGDYHYLDSSVLAFEIAARAAFRELRERASPKLLEPIMKVEVTTPENYVGGIIGDLNFKRGMIQRTDQRGATRVITALAPLANMFGYVNTLTSLSQGRANFHMDYDHYEAVPDVRGPEPPDDLYPPAIGMRA